MHGTRSNFMAGEGLKMAEGGDVAVFHPSSKSEDKDKENIIRESNMKTVSSTFSPFLKSGSKSFKILSDEEIQKGKKVGSKSKNKSNNKRKSLATLQPTSDGQGKLTGNGRELLSIKEAFKRKHESKHLSKNIDVKVTTTATALDKVELPTVNLKPDDIKEPVASTINKDEPNSDDQLIQDALLLMKQTEKVDDNYWKSIAEERREALEETLDENEKLYDKIDELQQENGDLKQKLNEAVCFKLLYQNLLLSREEQGDCM